VKGVNMANIFDVADYILKSIGTISTLKLQKLAYYCQAWSLAWDGKELFKEKFQAWTNGPVNQELFKYFQGEFLVSKVSKDMLTNSLTADEKYRIEVVLENYAQFSGAELSSLTHKEQPWIETRGKLPDGAPCSKVISNKLMQEFYSSSNK